MLNVQDHDDEVSQETMGRTEQPKKAKAKET